MTAQALIQKYGRLCGHVAQSLVRKSSNLTQEDAEDFASAAVLKLIKCPEAHRHEDPYIRTLINNAIRTVWRKRIGQLNAEAVALHQPSEDGQFTFCEDVSIARELLSKLSGDGQAGRTQRKFDAQLFEAVITSLPLVERTVLQLYFGLAGCNSFSQGQIAKKLGRSREWVEPRLIKGIGMVREQAGIWAHKESASQD